MLIPNTQNELYGVAHKRCHICNANVTSTYAGWSGRGCVTSILESSIKLCSMKMRNIKRSFSCMPLLITNDHNYCKPVVLSGVKQPQHIIPAKKSPFTKCLPTKIGRTILTPNEITSDNKAQTK